jgi:hypothetical protein
MAYVKSMLRLFVFSVICYFIVIPASFRTLFHSKKRAS